MDVAISFRQTGRRQPENKTVNVTLVNIKSVEQVQDWAKKIITDYVPKDGLQDRLPSVGCKSKA